MRFVMPHSVRSVIAIGSRQVTLAVLLGLLLLLLARVLGPGEFGNVASILAFTAALLPFSGMGLGQITLMRIARGEASPALCFGNSLAVTTVAGSVCVVIVVILAAVVLQHPHAMMLAALFGVSELLLSKYIENSAQVFWGLEQHAPAGLCLNILAAARLMMALLMTGWLPHPTALDWAVLHLASGVLALAVVGGMTLRRTGRPQVRWPLAWRDARQGGFFSLGMSGRNTLLDADKAILARQASAEISGAYSAAFRLVYMAYTPVLAVILSRRAHVYREGARAGLQGSLAATRRMALLSGLYGAALAAALYLGAALVPVVLGEAYSSTVGIVRALCVVPLFLVTQAILSDMLLGIDRHRTVAAVCSLAAALSVGLNLYLVPLYGWMGSVLAAYVAQGCLVAGLAASLINARGRQRRARLS